MAKTNRIKELKRLKAQYEAEQEHLDDLWERHDLHGAPNPVQGQLQQVNVAIARIVAELEALEAPKPKKNGA